MSSSTRAGAGQYGPKVISRYLRFKINIDICQRGALHSDLHFHFLYRYIAQPYFGVYIYNIYTYTYIYTHIHIYIYIDIYIYIHIYTYIHIHIYI